MARVDNTGGSGFTVDNGTGLVVRTKLNQIIAALSTVNQGSGDPTIGVAAYVPHIDGNTLKIRNAANNAFVSLGDVSQTNFGHAALSGSTFTGDVALSNQSDLRFGEATSNGSNYVGFQAPASITSNITWTLPATDASVSGYALVSNGSGVLSWAAAGGAGATGGGSDEVFFESSQNVTTSYTLSSNKHAHTVSPTINNGVTITVPNNAILVIL
jgi:hypothetical protein